MAITAMGMATSLGSADMGSRAARAGLSLIQELPIAVENHGVLAKAYPNSATKGHPYHNYTNGKTGLDRLLCLGQAAFEDMLESAKGLRDLSKTALIINLSDGFHSTICELLAVENQENPTIDPKQSKLAQQQASCQQELIAQLLSNFPGASPFFSTIGFGGKPGIVNSLMLAQNLLQQGQVDSCIIGAIESCLEPDYLQDCNQLEILKTDLFSDGFIPGEAAAFLLLENNSSLTQRPVLATVDSYQLSQCASQRFVQEDSAVDQAQALTDSLSACLTESLPADMVLYCDFSGEKDRAKTWSYSQTRMSQLLQQHPIRKSLYPAINFGEVGAPFAYVATIMACHAFDKGYADSDTAVIWTLSDNGVSGSLVLKKP